MEWLRLDYWAQSPDERALAVVVAAVLVVFLIALLFAVTVLALRRRNLSRDRHRESLETRWRAPLLDVLAGAVPADSLTAAVRPGEELSFLAFLLPFARRVRGSEAEILTRLAAPSLPRVERELERRSAEVRAVAVQLLGAFGMPAAAPRLIAALDDPSPYVAMTAAEALARREHAEHGAAVVARLWRFTSWSVEMLSAMLARIGATVAPATRAVLEDRAQPPRARAAAADGLRRLNDAASADLAAHVLSAARLDERTGDALHAAALRLLGQVGRASHVEGVRRWLDAPDPITRAEAVCSFAALAPPAEVAALAARLDDPSPHVGLQTAAALMRGGRGDLLEAAAAGGGPAALIARQVLLEGRRP